MALAKALVAAVRGGGPGRAQGKLAGAAAGQEHAEPDGANGAALEAGERYKKIVADTARLDALLVDLFLDCHGSTWTRRRARWRSWPGVEYVPGIAQNPRLKQRLAAELEQARQACERTGQAARAQCDTIRLKLLKIGVRIRVSVRAVRLSFDEGFPEAGLFGRCWPASRAYRCAVSNCTPGHRGEPRWSSPGALCPSSGWRGRTSGNTLAAGGPDQAFARIRCPTLRRDAIQPLQTDQTPQNLRLLSRSG